MKQQCFLALLSGTRISKLLLWDAIFIQQIHMLQNTRAIVLRTVNFGETSLVVSCFTEMYGQQSYLVKGARSTGKKGQSMRPYLQPGALLDLVVYYQAEKNLQYIRELRWAKVYQRVLSNVLHHGVATYMIELLSKCMKQTEPNPELFSMMEQYLMVLDEAEPAVVANLPLHFTLQLADILGFRPEGQYSAKHKVLDLREGRFTDELPGHRDVLEGNAAQLTHQLLQTGHPITLYRIKMNREQRQELLHAFETYFRLHIDAFGSLQSLDVLSSIF